MRCTEPIYLTTRASLLTPWSAENRRDGDRTVDDGGALVVTVGDAAPGLELVEVPFDDGVTAASGGVAADRLPPSSAAAVSVRALVVRLRITRMIPRWARRRVRLDEEHALPAITACSPVQRPGSP